MKTKKWFRNLLKINAIVVILGLIFGMTSFTPTVEAKTEYKTLAYDKKLEAAQDFEKGEFKNSKIKETADGIELSMTDGDIVEYISPIV